MSKKVSVLVTCYNREGRMYLVMKRKECRLCAGEKADVYIRTLKLKLSVVGEDKEEKNKSWRRIRQISNDVWKAANMIASGQYLNDQLVRHIYARRKIDPKDMSAIQQIEEEFKAFFGTKRQATTERDIKQAYPNLPSCVTNRLNSDIVRSYGKEKSEMLSGNRSLRSYRKGLPVPIHKSYVSLFNEGNGHHCVEWKLGRKESISFQVYYGKDKANNRLTVDRILKGANDYSAPQLQLKDRNLFLLLPVKEPKIQIDLDPQLSLGADLGLAPSVYVALSKGKARKKIGFKEDFLKVRTQMQSRRRRLQASLKSAHSGKGRTKKLKALEHIKKKEANFARSYNHFLSKEVVNFAVKHKTGVIKVEMLEGFGQDKRHAFVLRNWSYFELQTMIEYKAKRAGIKVVKVDPYHTSQTCSACGHYEEGQRSQRVFKCKSCGETFDADHNAALNIARSDKIVTKKEQCEFHMKQENKLQRLVLQPKGEVIQALTNPVRRDIPVAGDAC